MGGKKSISDEEDVTRSIEALADEALARSELMTDALWQWLHSREALSSFAFFGALGRKDTATVFCARIELEVAKPEGVYAFSSYWRGSDRDCPAAESRLDELAAADSIDGKAVLLATSNLPATEAGVARIVAQLRRGRVIPEVVADVIVRGGWMAPLTPSLAEGLFREIAGADFRNGSRVMDLLHMWLHLKKPLADGLEDLAWQILESDPPVSHNDAWDFDQLAARLASRNPERGFMLLERLACSSRDKKWKPVESHGENKFWRTLCSLDRKKALDITVRAAVNRFELGWALKQLLNPGADRDAILTLARQSTETARFLAGCLTAGADGFWGLAGELLALYPDDDELWIEIAGDIEGLNTTIAGPQSAYLERRKQQVKEVLADAATPAILRRRLNEWLERAEDSIGRHVVWEYDEDIDGLMRHVHDKNSNQRIWAIGRILKHASFEEMRKLLTVEDIKEALPQVDLPDERRRLLEGALDVWKNGHVLGAVG